MSLTRRTQGKRKTPSQKQLDILNDALPPSLRTVSEESALLFKIWIPEAGRDDLARADERLMARNEAKRIHAIKEPDDVFYRNMPVTEISVSDAIWNSVLDCYFRTIQEVGLSAFFREHYKPCREWRKSIPAVKALCMADRLRLEVLSELERLHLSAADGNLVPVLALLYKIGVLIGRLRTKVSKSIEAINHDRWVESYRRARLSAEYRQLKKVDTRDRRLAEKMGVLWRKGVTELETENAFIVRRMKGAQGVLFGKV